MLLPVGLEHAFIGIARRGSDSFGVYDEEKVVAGLMKDGMTRKDAIEYFDYNIAGAWVGDSTSAFVQFGTVEDLHDCQATKDQ